MKRYIKSSESKEILGLTQSEMEAAWNYIESNAPKYIVDNKVAQFMETDSMPFKYKYYLAKTLATETANEMNFFMNSIGMWERVSRKPKGMPDFDSTKLKSTNHGQDYYATNGSLYWYTPEGVYRNSDHWNGRIASCTWYIDDTPSRKGTGFIRWSDLQPKGYLDRWVTELALDNKTFNSYFQGMQLNKFMYHPNGFTFEKQRYYV
ncbi:hypothetical protein [Ruminococcus sp.]|uniref:hypothetical protein n=1 Tax=Ruminococcus sp. TaxID=41978 RepID=UPI001B4AF847|nr:hypothetical protein [Ruminococcus sp.]MBP5433735.1 hypothetical protein [Ruminococcus sp.]